MTRRYVALNEDGRPIGQYHHNATVPEVLVSRCRDLREEQGLSYGAIARMLGLKRSYVQKVCNYEIRAQQAHGWKRLAQEGGAAT